MRILSGILLLFLLVGVLPNTASAHPTVDKAIASYEEADFRSALLGFEAAARDADLTIDELTQVFEMRALVYHAIDDRDAMTDDLRRLAAVRPDHALSPLAPPLVRAAFDEAREANRGVGLRIEERTVGGAPSVVARVAQAPPDLVDRVTLQCTIGSRNETISRTSQGIEAKLKLSAPGAHKGCEALARTWQGNVLFRASIDAPLLLTEPTPQAFQMPQYASNVDRTSEKKKRKKWPAIVAAVGAATIAGITAGVVVSKRSNDDGSNPSLGGARVRW